MSSGIGGEISAAERPARRHGAAPHFLLLVTVLFVAVLGGCSGLDPQKPDDDGVDPNSPCSALPEVVVGFPNGYGPVGTDTTLDVATWNIQNFPKAGGETVDRVAEGRRKRVGTGELNRFIKRITQEHPPVAPGTRGEVRVMYAVQSDTAPPTFVLFTNQATKFHFSYERFILNQLRAEYGFEGTPIRLQVRKSE